LVFGLACEAAPESEIDCSATGSVEGDITLVLATADDAVKKDLLVRGTATHSEGLAIRKITVAGVTATQEDGFNFDSWEAVITFDRLLALVGSSEDNTVTIAVTALDSCDRTSTIGTVDVAVSLTPDVVVNELSITATIPGIDATDPSDGYYLPADGNVPAIVTITGNPEAANAKVALEASHGTLSGGDEGFEGLSVTLTGDGIEPAKATLLYTSETPGVALLSATSGQTVATKLLTVAGAPALIPSGGALLKGQQIRVTVFTDGQLEACQATPTVGLTVTSGGGNLMEAPGGEVTSEGRIEIDVLATEDVEASTVVTCVDIYGQASTGEYSVDLLPPPDDGSGDGGDDGGDGGLPDDF
jgi:hypothetical protein